MNKRKKVAITFAYLQNNIGDDLFVEHLCLRYPNVDFYIMDSNVKNITLRSLKNLIFSKEMKKYFKEYDSPSISDEAKRFYGDFDACLMIGGSIFMQHNHSWQSKIRNFRNRMSVNKNSYVLGANFGPFNDPKYLTEFTRVFQTRLKDMCFRDSVSASYFPDSTNIRYAPDILFSYKHEKPAEKNQIAISVINGYFTGRPVVQCEKLKAAHNKYVDKIVELCSEISKRGFDISLLSFCNPQGDLRVAEIIESKCLKNGLTNVRICAYNGNTKEFLDEIASSKAVVATRFHAMILGFLFGKPVYPIIYDEKQKYVLQDLNFYGESCPIEKIDEVEAKDIVDCLLDTDSKNSYKAMKHMIDDAIVKSEEQFAELDKLLREDGE